MRLSWASVRFRFEQASARRGELPGMGATHTHGQCGQCGQLANLHRALDGGHNWGPLVTRRFASIRVWWAMSLCAFARIDSGLAIANRLRFSGSASSQFSLRETPTSSLRSISTIQQLGDVK